MTHIRKTIVLFIIIISAISCKAQQIKISVSDRRNIENLNLIVSLLVKNDTLVLKDIKPNFYAIKESKNSFLISYDGKKYFLKDIENDVKSIVIEYNPNAENNCFIINKIFNDVIQLYNPKVLQNCSDVSNIYMYNTYSPKSNNSQIRIRKSK